MMRVSELCWVCGGGWHAEGSAVTGGSGAAVMLGKELCGHICRWGCICNGVSTGLRGVEGVEL